MISTQETDRKRYSVAVIGGGASGLMCAAFLAKYGAKDVVVLERNDRVGKKLSATGNGQGNITNRNMNIGHYFTDSPDKAEKILSAFDEKATVSFLEELGGLFECDERGRVYPASRQASSVVDLLRGYLAFNGVEIKLGFFAKELSYKNCFSIGGDNETVFADTVVLCGGGKAQKNFGSDGNAYSLARSFGHTLTKLYPSLVQMKTDTEPIKTLRGLRVDARLTASVNGRILGQSRGDVLFTEYGISGNAAFCLSPYLADQERAEISVEFLPDVDREKLQQTIANKMQRRRDIEKTELLGCILNNQIGRSVAKRASSFSAEAFVSAIKDFRLQYRGTLGFDYAQATKGGIPLTETDDLLQSKRRKGLYFCGEILNVDGECGGYNLQWAFSSAYAAARGILKI